SWVAPAQRQRVLALLAGLEREKKVVRRPLLPRSVLFAEAYPAADAFVMPSHAEGFGFTNVEALSFGLPVVSSKVGAIPETVAEGRTGFLVPPGDVSALAAAMERLVAEPAHVRRLGEAARADFLSRFTRERFRAELARVYRDALSPLGQRVG
ncbi:MAG: glycosyl transferase family 1, partial [Acidobacteria bacterium]